MTARSRREPMQNSWFHRALNSIGLYVPLGELHSGPLSQHYCHYTAGQTTDNKYWLGLGVPRFVSSLHNMITAHAVTPGRNSLYAPTFPIHPSSGSAAWLLNRFQALTEPIWSSILLLSYSKIMVRRQREIDWRLQSNHNETANSAELLSLRGRQRLGYCEFLRSILIASFRNITLDQETSIETGKLKMLQSMR